MLMLIVACLLLVSIALNVCIILALRAVFLHIADFIEHFWMH